jgi:hypothetical protein
MLKIMIIVIALLIAVVNVSAQTSRIQKRVRRVHQATAIRVGPPTTYLKEGLTDEQVLRILGEPIAVSKREVRGIFIETYEFQRGANRILVAEFVKGALVSSRTETRDTLVAGR